MTGAERRHRSGQAMVELLIGLVGIVFLMLGLSLITQIVVEDFDSLIGSRDDVADSLINRSGGMAYDGAGAYRPQGGFYGLLQANIQYDDPYQPYLENYMPEDRSDGFASVLSSDPLADVVGAQGGTTIPIDSAIMRRMIGSRIQINNAVWMPTWQDLMYE